MADAVITVVAGRHEHVRSQRAALARSDRQPDLHVVVSMGDPGVEEILQDGTALTTRLVNVPVGNAGLPLAAARNAGANAAIEAGADLLVMLDVDCLPDPGMLSRYHAAADTDRGRAALLSGPVTYLPAAPAAQWTTELLRQNRAPHPARPDPDDGELEPGDPLLFWSLSFAVSAATWRKIGGFCPAYDGYGGEDTDFALLADAAGIPLVWVGGADAYHLHHPVSRPPVEHLDDIVRNGALFAERWGWWPMTGWLEAFERLALVHRDEKGWVRSEPVRLASIPATHPYIDAVRPPSTAPALPGRVTGWSPDPLLDPGQLRAVATDIDVVHLHFGYDHLDLPAMDAWLDCVRECNLPLVVTVHDLRNPHHADRSLHDAHLQQLIAAADAVFTLTEGAADEIRERFGRLPVIAPHPSLIGSGRAVSSQQTELGLVTIHLKSLRTNVVDIQRLTEAAIRGVSAGGGRLRIDVHRDAYSHPALDFLTTAAKSGALELAVHDRFSDDELYSYIGRAHVCLLPYRFGTHSGWLELCRDLGTRVVAPDCGYFAGAAGQWADVISYSNNESTGLDELSVRDAIAAALSAPPPAPADPLWRAAQALQVREAHAQIYANVLHR